MGEKKLLLGNAAVARGLYEAGCRFVSSYPGTPSTEITECAAGYEEIYAEWAPNEKVAAEAAIGASIGGGRAFCGMKHVGLNVASDPVFISGYTGVNGGLVIGVADDSGMHSSQNEQDSRHLAIAAKLPMLEPSDSAECLKFTKLAFEFSEKFDTPVILRLSTRISHSQGIAEIEKRQEAELKPYIKDASKYVMMPSYARDRHTALEARMAEISAFSENCEFNKIEYNKTKIGIVSSGIAYQYAREVFGDEASYFKLGLVNPLPVKSILEFAANVDRLIVIEELDDVIESWCKKNGVDAEGKNILPLTGEYSQELLQKRILGQTKDYTEVSDIHIPARPPVLCPGCPHRGMFHVLKKLKLFVSGDIGCYTLGANAPLSAMDTTLCMGASVSALHGFDKVRGATAKNSIAVIGDSTFMHSGITGLIGITYNKGISKVLILDNSITAMTGRQHNPSTGYTLKGEAAPAVSLEGICAASGIKEENIKIFDPCDIFAAEKILKEELAKDEPCVLIARRPCVLLGRGKKDKKREVRDCRGCRACISAGCPAIRFENKKAEIDPSLCAGCGVCEKLCKFKSISEVE